MPARPPLLTSRRTALGGALLGLGAAGCSLDRPVDPADRAAGTPGASASAAAEAEVDGSDEQDPDAALVDDVLAELAALTSLTDGVATRFARLRPRATALADLHRAHREALGDEVAATDDPDGAAGRAGRGPRPRDAAAALRLLRSRELRAQRRLAEWSVAAQSGALARLLASMSAAVAQQVAVLPTAPARPERRP